MKPIFRTLVWLDSHTPKVGDQILIAMYYDGWNYDIKVFSDKKTADLQPWEINPFMLKYCYWAYLDEVEPPFDPAIHRNLTSGRSHG